MPGDTTRRRKRPPTTTRKTAEPTQKTAEPTQRKRASTRRDGTNTRRTRSSSRRARAATPMLPSLIGVYEPTSANARRATDAIRALGYTLVEEESRDELCARIASPVPPDIVLVGMPGGEAVLEAVAAKQRVRPVVIAALAGPAQTAIERCEQIEADLLTLRPHSKDSLCAVLRAASVVAADRQKLAAMRGTEEVLRERLQRYGQADAATGFQHFDFFKQLLLMELKRAKRYGYSLAACLVALDPWASEQPEPPPAAAATLRTRVASAIASCIRDIDLPVDFAEDRFLVFLPYTDIKGAERVGRRIAASVRSYGGLEAGGVDYQLSVSVGIAALRPNKPVSFARLIREAGTAVRASQLKGGGRVVVRS